MGVSLEVVEAWVKSCREAKQLDRLVSLVEQQRVALADKAAVRAKRKTGKG
jgi:hypothetical protein